MRSGRAVDAHKADTSFGLLPDFYASRMPGTLDAIEEAAAKAEMAPSVEKAADQMRPADAPDAVTLGAAGASGFAVDGINLNVQQSDIEFNSASSTFPYGGGILYTDNGYSGTHLVITQSTLGNNFAIGGSVAGLRRRGSCARRCACGPRRR